MAMVAGCSSGPSLEQAKQSSENMGKICMAIINVQDATKKFPLRALTAKDGKPGLSWRVAILPYLNEEKLYGEFHLDEPWDSEHNRPLLAKMPAVFMSPMIKTDPGFTNYLAVVGERAVLTDSKPIHMMEIPDGTANTIMVVEANDAVEWTKPADYTPAAENPAAGLGKLHPKDHFLAGFASGDVYAVPATLEAKSVAAMFTRNGARDGIEDFNWGDYRKAQKLKK
jgi:uncharacterized protein DUF1559